MNIKTKFDQYVNAANESLSSRGSMNKTETTEVMHAFADCLRLLYQKAGLVIPAEFDAEREADRLGHVLNGYKEYPCGCLAGPGDVPDYCPNDCNPPDCSGFGV